MRLSDDELVWLGLLGAFALAVFTSSIFSASKERYNTEWCESKGGIYIAPVCLQRDAVILKEEYDGPRS